MTQNLLTIEDSTILAMLKDPRTLELLPCLNGPKLQIEGIKPGGENCARCQADKKRITADAMRTARNCIRNTRGSRLENVKEMLGARQLRVIANNSKGQRVNFTL
jgi:hypothetical protein